MSKKLRSSIVKYAVAVAISGALSYSYAVSHGVNDLDRMNQYRVLCDAFVVPGVVMLMAGLLMTLSGMGSLDGVGYAVSKLFRSLVPGANYKGERYADYIERKHSKGPSKGHHFLYVVSAVWVAIGLVFRYLFYTLY